MGFLDDLGKKVADAGQMAMQKTQEMTEVARINSLISQNENKIHNAYFQIGKLFVSMYGNECKEEFAEMVATISELEQQNVTYRKQIQDIKGTQQSVKCPNCGAMVKEGMKFCTACGQPMAQAADVPAAAGEEASGVPEETAVEMTEKICAKCGAKLAEDSAFCTECGTKV